MDEAKLQEIEARATAIHAEMTHTRARCDDCGAVNPRLDDCGLHDGCPAGDWPRPPMRDWTKHEGTEGLCEIARHMTDLVAEVRRLTAALDAARREGAEGMREAAARCCSPDDDRFDGFHAPDVWEQIEREIRALPLDAPTAAPAPEAR